VLQVHQPQKFNKKLNELQTSAMIKVGIIIDRTYYRPFETFEAVCVDAVQREQGICKVMGMANVYQDPFLKSFGVEIEPRMFQMKARCVKAPMVQYNQSEVRFYFMPFG